jgi:molybdopterin-containing oxidoreductase family iron-sulfur binding subunit
MFWLRIDRYYGEHTHPEGADYDWESTAFRSDEHAAWLQLAENPTVVHQPVMCQHCENAPCETVCPVLATVHSREGLNAMAYNRCIGTRYCANNCPFKVRRFNWFQYPSREMDGKQDLDLVALALNPDVVKRSRGVMEKCSMCVQRIQSAKSEIVRQGRQPTDLRDGDVNTACAQACPSDAITFGNQIDKSSALAKANEDPRKFVMLDFLNVRPSVSYMTRVRNSVDV